ncbi:hypothetical protein ID866_1465 [Astraeus odoratus]|nr:hypothetical protein ID866_1465 [Astraeus odoratus]
MSHALLLRLFLSPSFFSVHVALQYLMQYADNIGITYYLTRRLRELDTQELRDVWGFICHLLVTRPSKSRALECFVVEIAQRSTHIAMMTLWFMQASLRDLSASPNSQSFQVCQRTLLKCHEIIFSDLPSPASVPYSALSVPFHSRFSPKKVKPRVEPALVGIGLLLAGAPVMPKLTEIMGEVALQQGRADDDVSDVNTVDPEEGPILGASSTSVPDPAEDDDNASEEKPENDQSGASNEIPSGPNSQLQRNRSLLARRRTVVGAQTSPALINLTSRYPRVYRVHTSLPPRYPPLTLYDTAYQLQMLSSKGTTFSVSLISSETIIRNQRIVRIPPGESVVLNSAERAPYLLLIEVLHDDLDFDSTKRGNKEVLKRIVTKENEKKGAARDLTTFSGARVGTSPTLDKDKDVVNIASSENVLGKDSANVQEGGDEGGSLTDTIPLQSDSTTSLVPDEQEMDLVEQLYGTGQSLRGPIDLEESIVLPPPPKNRELELAAWSRAQSSPSTPVADQNACSSPSHRGTDSGDRVLSLDDYSERMRTAAVMLTQLNASLVRETITPIPGPPTNGSPTIPSQNDPSSPANSTGPLSWFPGSGWLGPVNEQRSTGPLHPSLGGKKTASDAPSSTPSTRMRVNHSEAAAIRDRIMKEMLALEEERMARMREGETGLAESSVGGLKTVEDEGIIKRELNKADPSAVVFSESWDAKKSRIRYASPYGHLANWDCVSVIVKTGGDLRQEQVAVQLIREFERIWQEEKCQCWVRYFRILITGASSGLVETITDAVSIHSIKKAEYARRLAEGRFGYVTLLDHFRSTYGDPSTAKFVRAQRNFAKSLAGYSIVTYLLQIKDRHNGNILLDREGHLIHIDFGFMLSNSPGNIGFEAAPFKLPPEYVEVLGGVDSEPFLEFKRLFREGFEAARKHCNRIIKLMQKDSALPCFAAFGEQTAAQLRDRFQPALTHSLVREHIDRLIDSSLGSNWTRLYDSFQYYSQSIL